MRTPEVVSARTIRRVENKILRVLEVIEERQRQIESDQEQIRKYIAVLAKHAQTTAPAVVFPSAADEALARGLQLVRDSATRV